MKSNQKYDLNDPDPNRRAFAWGIFHGLSAQLKERKHIRNAKREAAVYAAAVSADARGWDDADYENAAIELIKQLNRHFPNWRDCEGKRLTGSIGNKSSLGALLRQACGLKDQTEAKRRVRHGAEQLSENGNRDLAELLSKPWF